MNDAASFDAILQCNLLEVFCEALGAAIVVTDKLDQISFASIRLLHLFPIRESAIAPGGRARDLYGALYDGGIRFGTGERPVPGGREEWIAERIACGWKERVDKIELAGPERWMRIISRRFSSGLGFVVIQDVSEQKKKEELLRVEQERVNLTEEILDNLPIAVAVKDRNLDYVAVNKEFCGLLGTTRDAILGRRSWDALSPELAGRVEQMDWQLLSSGEPAQARITHTRPDGQPVTLNRRALRLGNPGNPYIAVTLTNESEVGAAPREAAPVATPEALPAEPALSPASHRNVLYLNDTSDQSLALKLALRAHDVDLCYVRDVPEFAAFLPAARASGVRIDLVIIDFDFDPAAFNVAAASGINFRMLPQDAGESGAMAEILNTLPETAAGMDRAMIAVPPLDPAGEGLLPIQWIDEPIAVLDILAVEDNVLNRMVLEQMLGGLDMNVLIAGTAAEALSRCEALVPRIVLADTTLPDMEIDEFLGRLHDIDPARPVIALVPGDTDEHYQQAKSMGFDDWLSKPLSAEALNELLARHLGASLSTVASGIHVP